MGQRVSPGPSEDSAMSKPAGDGRPVVEVLTGKLRGRRAVTPEGTTYFSFKGVPYGKPPLAELRFKAPLPAAPWSGVRDASCSGNLCMQPIFAVPLGPPSWSPRGLSAYIKCLPAQLRHLQNLTNMSEDCLYLNVYTPQLPEADDQDQPLLPVLVWLHGGGFRMGDGDVGLYGPEYLMDVGGIVVVTVNYRVGPFGFLAVGTDAAPGNAGLKDQVLALKWVRDNIASFGGDPGQVTLFGESAGGVAAHMHTLSPLSKGLFHRIMTSSGLSSCDWGMVDAPLERALELAAGVGVSEQDPDRLVEQLRAVPAADLNKQHEKMRTMFKPLFSSVYVFVPVVEPASEGAFLTEDPIKVVSEGRQHQVPLLAGFNSREGLLYLFGLQDSITGMRSRRQQEKEMDHVRQQKPETFLPRDLYISLPEDERDALGKDILQFYFGRKGPCVETFENFIDMFGDILVAVPVLRMSALQAATGSTPVFNYYFSYETERPAFKTLIQVKKYKGVSHGDDLGYIFRAAGSPATYMKPSEGDIKCQARVLSLWSTFIKTGDPTPPDSDISWTPRGSALQYLDVADEVLMKTDEINPRIKFWDEVYRKYFNMGVL